MFYFLDQNLRWISLLPYGLSLETICYLHQQLAQRRRSQYTIFPWWLSYMDISLLQYLYFYALPSYSACPAFLVRESVSYCEANYF